MRGSRPVSGGSAGLWSSSALFKIAWGGAPGVVTLASPTNGTQSSGSVNYTWNARSKATWYRLWINKGSAKFYDNWVYSGPQAEGAPVTKAVTGHTNGTYTWWVQSWGPDGASAVWSNQGQFTVLLGP